MYIQQKLEQKKLPTDTDCYTETNYVDEEGNFISIEEIKKIINRDLSNKVVWNAKENFRMAQVALHFCNQLGVKILPR